MSELQDFYIKEIGEETFKIPVEYILDTRNRADGSDDYVTIMANYPDLSPIENARTYNRLPYDKEGTFWFSLELGGKGTAAYYLNSYAEKNGVDIPGVYSSNGLIQLKVNQSKSRRDNEKVYAIAKDGKLVCAIECSPYACQTNVNYRDTVSIKPFFKIDKFNWFTQDGGMEAIAELVESWRVKKD
jgi:hypothetical protein